MARSGTAGTLSAGICGRIVGRLDGPGRLDMFRLRTLQRSALVCSVLCALLGACTSQREPAQRMMQDIETTLGGVSEDAAKYVPGELVDVQTKLDDLKTAYNAHD